MSPEVGQRADGPIIEVPPTLGDPSGAARRASASSEFVQTYFIETDLPNLVYAASRPTQVIFDGALWTRPDGALRSDVTLTSGSVYTVVSDRIQVTAEALRAQGDLGEVFGGYRESTGTTQVDPFLELPASTTARTVDLAASLRAATTYDTILAYQQWLATNTQYDLDAPVPPDGADAVDDFLFESKLGFCEQIASTLVIMLRSQGVPARLATGYVPGERDRVAGVWKVARQRCARLGGGVVPAHRLAGVRPDRRRAAGGRRRQRHRRRRPDRRDHVVGASPTGWHLVALAAIAVVLLVAVRAGHDAPVPAAPRPLGGAPGSVHRTRRPRRRDTSDESGARRAGPQARRRRRSGRR